MPSTANLSHLFVLVSKDMTSSKTTANLFHLYANCSQIQWAPLL